jgi:hypothetical protein
MFFRKLTKINKNGINKSPINDVDESRELFGNREGKEIKEEPKGRVGPGGF